MSETGVDAAPQRANVSSRRSKVRPQQQLCSVCQSINFARYHHHEMSWDRTLGNWGEIVQEHSCPFCRLVVQSLMRKPGHSPRDVRDRIVLSNHLSWQLGIEMSPYDKLRSEAYSTKFDLRSMAKNSQDSIYRLIVEPEGRPEDAGFVQYVLPSQDSDSEEQFSGRQIDRTEVDVDLLRSWLDRCDKFHGDVCEDNGHVSRRLPEDLRLIDVETRNLVKAPSRRTFYVTLSYVWGTEDMKRATGKEPAVTNRADLQRTAAGRELTPLPDNLPQTIEDAITLTRQLGFRYLWVDALCIIQDDPIEQKNVHLGCMDAIYNCSELTIVAASGLHADTGLPGISVPRRSPQVLERIGVVQMAAMAPSFTELENDRSLIWNTRGWTFQEKVFAKRMLLFTDFQVYFRCSESVWTEEVAMETEYPSKSIEARPAKFRWAVDREPFVPSRKLLMARMILPSLNVNDEWSYLGNFPDYAAAIREYSQRSLSRQDDKLIAIHGILQSLQADAGRFLCGLPEAYFLQSLLWHPEPGSHSVRENTNLPSWTWAGWHFGRGVVFDVLDIRVIRMVLLLLQNAYLSTKKALVRLWDFVSEPSDSSSSSSSGDTSYADSSNTTSTSSSSSSKPSSSSGPPMFPPPIPPKSPRDWTTMNAMSKASVNIFACFGWPLLFRHHTVRQAFLYENGEPSRIKCEEPLTLSAFMKDQQSPGLSPSTSTNTSRTRGRNRGQARNRSRSSSLEKNARGQVRREPSMDEHRVATAQRFTRPVLAVRTIIVEYYIGECLQRVPPQENDEVSCFELLDSDRACVGEVWTTRANALKGREKALEFLTISWGLSFAKAEIAEKYVPRWDFDASVLPKSRTKLLMSACKAFESVMKLTASKHLSATYGFKNSADLPEQPSLMSFFDALLTAHKDQPRPKFLWSTVNVLLVEHVRDHGRRREDRIPVFKRTGVGRVIFDAWLFSSSVSQIVGSSFSREVILE